MKPLYGHQQAAAIGYNPQKPGRPSHVYHSYFVASLRISLGVEIRPGNEHAAARGLPGLWQALEKLPRHQWPTFTRITPPQSQPERRTDKNSLKKKIIIRRS